MSELDQLHARIKAAIAACPDDTHPADIVSVVEDLLAWLIVHGVEPLAVADLTAAVVQSLRQRVGTYKNERCGQTPSVTH
jgi:hypothetical protein